jgi:4-amino-4-deoxy-L-arabinose transferase-like glycosyltransferase
MQTNLYSQRFATPIFYLAEMTVPLDYMHPIYLPIFIFGLLGLGLFLWRRNPHDRLFLIWFVVVYVFFTLIASKSWRYVMPLFPVVAVSAACFLSFLYDKSQKSWKLTHLSINKKKLVKFSAGVLVVFTVGAVVASTVDAYGWVSRYANSVPLPQAVHYTAQGLEANESMLLLCPTNLFFGDMAKFYLKAYESMSNPVWQYPVLPVDAYTPQFNMMELTAICHQRNVRYLLLYEDAGVLYYFNSTLGVASVADMITKSDRITYQATFGEKPNRIFVFQINGTAT